MELNKELHQTHQKVNYVFENQNERVRMLKMLTIHVMVEIQDLDIVQVRARFSFIFSVYESDYEMDN